MEIVPILIILHITFTLSSQPPYGQTIWAEMQNGINSIGRRVSNSACLMTATSKMNKCMDEYRESFKERKRDKKTVCCAFNALKSCIENIAERECGDDGQKVAGAVMARVQRVSLSKDCVQFGFLRCITPTQILTIGVVATGLLMMLLCCCR